MESISINSLTRIGTSTVDSHVILMSSVNMLTSFIRQLTGALKSELVIIEHAGSSVKNAEISTGFPSEIKLSNTTVCGLPVIGKS